MDELVITSFVESRSDTWDAKRTDRQLSGEFVRITGKARDISRNRHMNRIGRREYSRIMERKSAIVINRRPWLTNGTSDSAESPLSCRRTQLRQIMCRRQQYPFARGLVKPSLRVWPEATISPELAKIGLDKQRYGLLHARNTRCPVLAGVNRLVSSGTCPGETSPAPGV